MRLILSYDSKRDVAAALAELRKNKGILYSVADQGLAPGASLTAVIRVGSREVEIAATVIQALAGHGLAVHFDADHESLAPLRGEDGGSAENVEATWHDGEPSVETGKPRKVDLPLRERLKTATKPEKIQLALHGTRPERNLLIRDRDKSLHQYVIRNPKLGLDEVAAIARMSNLAPDVLAYIAGKREWFQRPDIASALIRNPKVSAVVAKKLLNFVTNQELRQLAKGSGVREAIAQEARRRLLRKR